MATFERGVVISGDTLAHYTGWGQAVHDGMLAAGWTRASDTGQVDWSSLSAVPSGGVMTEYEIWRMTDPLQISMPIYLRLAFGYSTGNGMVYMQAQVGTGTNGSGALTGARSTLRSAIVQTSTSATPTIYAAGDGSWLTLLVGLPLTGSVSGKETPVMALMIDRSRDDDGQVVDDGLFFGSISNPGANSTLGNNFNSVNPYTNVWQQMFSRRRQAWANASPGMPVLMGGLHWATTFQDSKVYVAPMMTTHPRMRPGLAVLGAYLNDFKAANPVDLTVLGATHTYMPLDYTADSCNPMGYASMNESAGGRNHSLLVRYE